MNAKSKLITALSIILTSVFLATSLINYAVTREAVRQELLQSSLPLTGKNIYSEVHSAMMRPILVSSTMANDAFLKNWAVNDEGDTESLARYLKGINDKYGFLTTFFISSKTDNYYFQKGLHKKISPRDSHDVWYYAFLRSRKEYSLDVDTNKTEQDTLTIFVNFRVEDENKKLLGVAGVGVNMDQAAAKLKEAQAEFHRMAYLVDQDGLIQVHPDKSLIERKYITEDEGLRAIAPDILSVKDRGANFEYDQGGKHFLLTTRYLPEFEWHLIVTQDEETALSSARNNFIRTLIIGFISSILILFLCMVTVNHFQRRLENMAKTDPLTGAANRRELEERFKLAAYKASRYKAPFSIIIMDLDGFKAINDRLGHVHGDKILESMSETIKRTIRPADLLARWGGDEFILLLDGDIDDAMVLDGRIRTAMTECMEIPVSFSSGITGFKEDDDITSMSHRADMAMYKAKKEGGGHALFG